jgi:hypothetical protein
MPKVRTKVKAKAGKEYVCVHCRQKIEPGEQYMEWKFRYGGTRRQHASHGSPKPSQLTQSKMSGAYAAIEAAQEAVDAAGEVSEVREAMEECREGIEGVREEYQESFDSIPENLQSGAVGESIQEKITGLEDFMNELEAVDIEDHEDPEPEEPQPGTVQDESSEEYQKLLKKYEDDLSDWEDVKEQALENAKQAAREVLEGFSL